jgi:hypothetical protein
MINVVNEGDVYLLNFSAISNSNTAKLNINYTSSTGTSPKTFITNTTRKDYSIPITFNDNNAGGGQYLYFTLHDKGAKVWLDNISLQKVTVNQTTPTSSMRFDVNPTDNAMQISLGSAVYKDVYSNSYTGTYTLEPYGSRILQNVNSIITPNKLVENNNIEGGITVYPSPNRNLEPLRISIQSKISMNSIVRISAIDGKTVFNSSVLLHEGCTILHSPILQRGVYLLEVCTPNGFRYFEKFIQ